MAKEITLNAVAIVSEATLRQALDAFEEQHHLYVNLIYCSWADYRQEFTNIALHHLPGDVAITGTPATSDLIAMNALRPFSKGEVALLGGEAGYLPSRWRAGMRPNDTNAWAIPFVVDPRILYYRRDLLAKAGVAEGDAFDTPQQLEQTIQRLHEAGITVPWFVEMSRFGMLHRVSSWIWAYGGDLFSPDSKRVTFHENEALEGMRAYFRLLRYVPADALSQDGRELLRTGRLGAIIENAFMLFNTAQAEIGCKPVLGASYVGGSDLVIWNHTRSESSAIELIRYLTRPDVAARMLPESYYLPARMSDLKALSNRPDPYSVTIADAVFNGRTFPCVPMIGLIEDRLGTALLSIQQELLINPQADLEALLQQRIVTLGRRTNISLGSLP